LNIDTFRALVYDLIITLRITYLHSFKICLLNFFLSKKRHHYVSSYVTTAAWSILIGKCMIIDRQTTSYLHANETSLGTIGSQDITSWSRSRRKINGEVQARQKIGTGMIDDKRIAMQPFMLSKCVVSHTYARHWNTHVKTQCYTCHRIKCLMSNYREGW